LTHSHYDHASRLTVIKKRYKPKVFAVSQVLPHVDVVLKGGETLKIADREFEVIYTPGHSSDSICLYCGAEKILCAGAPLEIKAKDTTCEEEFIQALD